MRAHDSALDRVAHQSQDRHLHVRSALVAIITLPLGVLICAARSRID